MSPSETVPSGMRFPDWLFLLFLGLRLHGSIDWAWYLVAAPLFVNLAAIFVRSAVKTRPRCHVPLPYGGTCGAGLWHFGGHRGPGARHP